MAKQTLNKLIDVQVRATKKPLCDGKGLWIYPQGGSKTWFYRYAFRGQARQMRLGSYPDMTLSEARDLASVYRKMLKEDKVDPIDWRAAERKRIEEASRPAPTFTKVAAQYIRAHRRGWSNRKHARQWVATLKTYARPIIGNKPADQVTTEDVLRILKPIWIEKTETAKRVQGRVENVLDFAGAMKYRTGDNPARWRGHLNQLLPSPTKVQTKRHHPAMPYQDLPFFMEDLRGHDSISALALEWLILTATRTKETLGATWIEIDLKARVWTVPASRMKTKREHRVPITDPMGAILDRLPRIDGNPHLFVGAHYAKSLSGMSLLMMMRRMGYGPEGDLGDFVPHGFRSSFRDWTGEETNASRDVSEMALAHTIPNKAEAAYRRGDLFEKRRNLMNKWAKWCSTSV